MYKSKGYKNRLDKKKLIYFQFEDSHKLRIRGKSTNIKGTIAFDGLANTVNREYQNLLRPRITRDACTLETAQISFVTTMYLRNYFTPHSSRLSVNLGSSKANLIQIQRFL